MEAPPRWTLSELADLLQGRPVGPKDKPLSRPVPAGDSDPLGVTFVESSKYADKVRGTDIGAVIATQELSDVSSAVIVHPSPRLAFFHLLSMCERPAALVSGIDPSAVIDTTAIVAGRTSVGAGSTVGPRTMVMDGVMIGPGCHIGADCRLMPGVTLVQDVRIGDRVVLHPGVVIGSDGFGFVWNGASQTKVPQVGGVVVGDDVEIGSNSTVDRATCGDTVIGIGVKIDNLVQIGHNSRIGDHTVIAGQTGVSGSVVIGARCVIGGQVAFADHVSVTDDVVLAGRTGVMSDITEPGEYFGIPATPAKEAMRVLAAQMKLPSLAKRVRDLERGKP